MDKIALEFESMLKGLDTKSEDVKIGKNSKICYDPKLRYFSFFIEVLIFDESYILMFTQTSLNNEEGQVYMHFIRLIERERKVLFENPNSRIINTYFNTRAFKNKELVYKNDIDDLNGIQYCSVEPIYKEEVFSDISKHMSFEQFNKYIVYFIQYGHRFMMFYNNMK